MFAACTSLKESGAFSIIVPSDSSLKTSSSVDADTLGTASTVSGSRTNTPSTFNTPVALSHNLASSQVHYGRHPVLPTPNVSPAFFLVLITYRLVHPIPRNLPACQKIPACPNTPVH
jgi:hypothetical protein